MEVQKKVGHDYYAELDVGRVPLAEADEKAPSALASGFVDKFIIRLIEDKDGARNDYMRRTKSLQLELPRDLTLECDFGNLPEPSWLGLEVEFTLSQPWYSKDERPLHILDNPVRKDRVFGVPYMAAASWKGLLRWACRMQEGLVDYLCKNPMSMDNWQDPPWIVHLFGNEQGEEEKFQQHGALVFCPTWFSRVSFEVINPHSRKSRAGTKPIFYEVVPAGTTGTLKLLYAPLPGASRRDRVQPKEVICKLFTAIQALIETYGISAKRTAGWGKARIEVWRAFRGGKICEGSGGVEKFQEIFSDLFQQEGEGV